MPLNAPCSLLRLPRQHLEIISVSRLRRSASYHLFLVYLVELVEELAVFAIDLEIALLHVELNNLFYVLLPLRLVFVINSVELLGILFKAAFHFADGLPVSLVVPVS